MQTLQLPSKRSIPLLGQGAWNMGEDPSKRDEEIAAIRLGLDLGMSLIDTAEIYGNGNSEKLIAEAIDKRRKEVFLVSKVMPENATFQGTIKACEGSLKRLKTDYLDLYLLHWRGSFPLKETFQAFNHLKKEGKILEYGVSNFDVSDLEDAKKAGGNEIAINQVLYNLVHRGIEHQLLPWSQKHHIPIMAYSPIEQGKLLDHPVLKKIGGRHSATPSQIALAWILLKEGVMAIPKAGNPAHIKENHAALKIKLTSEDLADLDEAFPLPKDSTTLEMI